MVESYRLIGYANRTMADEDFRNDGADAGELCAGAELTVAYEVVLTDEGRRREGDEPWLTCAVRYQPAGERAGEAPAEQRFAVGRESWSAEPGDDWSLAAAVVEFGMLARDSEFVGTATADDAAALAESSASSLDTTDRAARRELADLIRQASRNAAFDGVVAAQPRALVGGFLLNYASASRELLVRCQGVPTVAHGGQLILIEAEIMAQLVDNGLADLFYDFLAAVEAALVMGL